MDYSRINPASVAWAYETSANLLSDELDRVRSLNEKAAQLAGFAGVVLAILGSIARDGFGTRLGRIGDVVFAGCYFGSAAALAATILWLVLLVYRPRRYLALHPEEIRNYLVDDRLLQAEPWALQIRTLRSIYPATRWAEEGVAQMTERIGIGAGLFAVGLMMFLGAVTTLGLGLL